jgi:hypothetical protein
VTYVILVNSPVGELDDGVGVQGNINIFASGVKTRARHGFSRNGILCNLVSITNSKVAETAGKLVDLLEFVHVGRGTGVALGVRPGERQYQVIQRRAGQVGHRVGEAKEEGEVVQSWGKKGLFILRSLQ